MDIGLVWDNKLGAADIQIVNNDLGTDEGLRSAILVSLFCDLGQWWGDDAVDDGDRVGSDLFKRERSNDLQTTRLDYERDARAALQWMIDDKVTDSVVVTASFSGPATQRAINIQVAITRPGASVAQFFRFGPAWDAEALKVT